MNKFRDKNPQSTSDDSAFDEYGDYKDVLVIDFYNKCGYCDDHDSYVGGWRGMQIDHFAPKTPFTEVEHKYENLVYSCFYCNNAKRNDWVTDSHDRPINDNGNKGYVYPKDDNYNALFTRSESGSIIPENAIGVYMYTKLNLGLTRHELICTMERINKAIDEIDEILKTDGLEEEIISVLTTNKTTFLENKNIIDKQFRKIIDAR